MKIKKYAIIHFYFLISTFVLFGCSSNPRNSSIPAQEIVPDFEDVLSENHSLAPRTLMLDHQYFQIAYNSEKRLAQYVVYQLTAKNLKKKKALRRNKFVADMILVNKGLPYVKPAEYSRQGFDKGHLAPSADFSWEQKANDLTFVMSNMVPQSPSLNRDAWRRLEDRVRNWACGEEIITVITGPILKADLPKLKSGLEIPQNFFKIVIDETPPKKIIAFLYHQSDKGNVLKDRIIPIEKLQSLSKLALNQIIPDLSNLRTRAPASVDEWQEKKCD